MKSITLSDGSLFQVWYDTDAESPRDGDTFGTMVTFHRRYDFTDERSATDFEDAGGLAGIDKFVKDINKGGGVALKIWGYDHGSMAIKAGERTYPFNDQWDSGLFGIIYANGPSLKARGVTRTAAEAILGMEVHTLDQYINGRVYGYTLSDGDMAVIDSCGGFYGPALMGAVISGEVLTDLPSADKDAITALFQEGGYE